MRLARKHHTSPINRIHAYCILLQLNMLQLPGSQAGLMRSRHNYFAKPAMLRNTKVPKVPKRRKASRKSGFYGPCSRCAEFRVLREGSGSASVTDWYCDGCWTAPGRDHMMQTPRKRKRSDGFETQNRTGHKAFTCTVCSKSFGTRAGLAIHVGRSRWCRQNGASAGVVQPKPGDRIAYVMHNKWERKQVYRGTVYGRGRTGSWFDVRFDDGDTLSVLMNADNRGVVWDYEQSDDATADALLGRALDETEAVTAHGPQSVTTTAIAPDQTFWYRCQHCNQAFASQRALKIHGTRWCPVLRGHLVTDARTSPQPLEFECQYCGQGFRSRRALAIHVGKSRQCSQQRQVQLQQAMSSMDAAVHLKSSLHSGIPGAASRTSRAASGTAIPAPKASKPKPGDRVVYLMHDESGQKQAYHGIIRDRSRCAVSKAFAPAGWFDIAFDDGDNLSVFMNLSNRGKVWDHAMSNDSSTISAALEQVLCDDAAAAGTAAGAAAAAAATAGSNVAVFESSSLSFHRGARLQSESEQDSETETESERKNKASSSSSTGGDSLHGDVPNVSSFQC